MKLGENIFKLRKDLKLSQEQLAEKVDVTRQTISNWELGETSPNPEQLKLLSKTLNVSIDELLNNDIKSVMVEKISNTEKLVEIIIKILKGIGILFIVFLIVTSILIFMFGAEKKEPAEESSQTIHLNCKLNDKEYSYLIEIDENGDIVEAGGSEYIQNIVKDKEFKKGKIGCSLETLYRIATVLDQPIDNFFKEP